jgi:HSP20 family protein
MCPGADRATLDISVVGDALTIRGERKAEPGIGDEHYHRRERALGPFHRTIALGERLDGDRTVASYANGMLRVELARQPELTPKKILIQN